MKKITKILSLLTLTASILVMASCTLFPFGNSGELYSTEKDEIQLKINSWTENGTKYYGWQYEFDGMNLKVRKGEKYLITFECETVDEYLSWIGVQAWTASKTNSKCAFEWAPLYGSKSDAKSNNENGVAHFEPNRIKTGYVIAEAKENGTLKAIQLGFGKFTDKPAAGKTLKNCSFTVEKYKE